MRIFDFKQIKWDTKFLIAYCCALIFAIISGIVLFKFASINVYFYNFAEAYLYYVFNFSNVTLFVSHLISELFYLYITFAIAYFSKFKALTLVVVIIKNVFIAIYGAILCTALGFGGVIVTIFVFAPTALVSFAVSLFLVESCRIINKKYLFFYPALLAVAICLIMLLLVNVLFRVVVIIV